MSVTPPPARARSTASFVTSYTAITSLPSAVAPWTPYPGALSTNRFAAVWRETGVE